MNKKTFKGEGLKIRCTNQSLVAMLLVMSLSFGIVLNVNAKSQDLVEPAGEALKISQTPVAAAILENQARNQGMQMLCSVKSQAVEESPMTLPERVLFEADRNRVQHQMKDQSAYDAADEAKTQAAAVLEEVEQAKKEAEEKAAAEAQAAAEAAAQREAEERAAAEAQAAAEAAAQLEAEAQAAAEAAAQQEAASEVPSYSYSGSVLNPYNGTVYGPSGKETYYNLDMGGVLDIMYSLGYSGSYWVREDGVKMFGDYIMVAADLSIHPRGSLVATSLGTGIVCDTGTFIYSDPYQIDIAVTW